MILLSIGDEVREGTYRLHSCFRRAVNFTDGRRLVTLVTPDIGAGPVNIVVGDMDLSPVETHSCASLRTIPDIPTPRRLEPCFANALQDKPSRPTKVRHNIAPDPIGSLRIERYSIVFAKRRFLLNETQSYGSLLQLEKETSREVFRNNLEILETTLIRKSHPQSLAFLLDEKRVRNFRTTFERAFVAQIVAGATRMFSSSGVKRLAGCGFGLTPSGDDFIAGMLIGLNILQRLTGRSNRRLVQTFYRAAKGRNLLSNSFLRLARDGRVSEKMQMLISTLFYHGDTEVKERTEEVMAAGETSGADLLTGFVMAVKRY